MELDPSASARRSSKHLRRLEHSALVFCPNAGAPLTGAMWSRLEQFLEMEVATLRALLGGRPIWSQGPGMQQYDAAVRGNEEQALCDLLHCRLDCIQHCSGQLEAFTEQCEGINSMLPNCRVNCATNSPNTSTRELAVCLVGQLRGVCKAEDFSSLFNIVLANFASVDVFLVFPDESCHKDVAVFKAAASIFRHNDLRVFPHCQSDELTPAETQFMQWFLTHEWWATHWHGLGYGGNNNTPALRRMMLSGKHSSACSKKLEIQRLD
eukprot:g14143.t1